jgi:hypothetical protein
MKKLRMKSDAQVTVAIPTYNRSELLKISLASVLAQDYPNFVVIVLDNASSDDTEAVVRSFADSRVTYIRNEINIGAMSNWNKAITLNTSPYLNIFLDDDVMVKGFIRNSVQLLDENPGVAFSYTLSRYIDSGGAAQHLQEADDVPSGAINGLEFLQLIVDGKPCTINPSTVLMRARALKLLGSFDSSHASHTFDRNLYYRLATHFDVGVIKKELVQVRLHEGQISQIAWRSSKGTGPYAAISERIDALAYLLRSTRAQDPAFREWLAERLLASNARRSELAHILVPDLYWDWKDRLKMAKRELLALIPPGETFILVDQEQWETVGDFSDHSVHPFLERDGQYWGPPPDDQTAIQELERMRKTGANFIVFGWPAFWWLDHYGGLHDYLSSKCRCILQNSRLIAYDLRP